MPRRRAGTRSRKEPAGFDVEASPRTRVRAQQGALILAAFAGGLVFEGTVYRTVRARALWDAGWRP